MIELSKTIENVPGEYPVDVNPNTEGLASILAKFNIEHAHDEAEV